MSVGSHAQAAAPPGDEPPPSLSFFAVVTGFTRNHHNALLRRTLNHQGQYRCSPDAHGGDANLGGIVVGPGSWEFLAHKETGDDLSALDGYFVAFPVEA